MKFIRKAKAADATRLFEILVESTAAGGAGYYPEDILEDWHRGRTVRGMSEVLFYENFYVLEDESEPRGYVHLAEGKIVGLFVDPKDHRKGYGRALFEFARNEIKERPIKILATLNAVEFYARFGFEKIAMQTVRRNERDIYVWEMELKE
ncbi:MAG: GNAT family N-acetyltransferase [Puniceicoccaceae bacterium]